MFLAKNYHLVAFHTIYSRNIHHNHIHADIANNRRQFSVYGNMPNAVAILPANAVRMA